MSNFQLITALLTILEIKDSVSEFLSINLKSSTYFENDIINYRWFFNFSDITH